MGSDENVVEIDDRLLVMLEGFARLHQVPVQTVLRWAIEEYVRDRIPVRGNSGGSVQEGPETVEREGGDGVSEGGG